jgi:phosphatidylinositol dimannoside acyltransferase
LNPSAKPILGTSPPAPSMLNSQNERDSRVARESGRYNPAPTAIRRWAADFWLNYFFWHAERFPRLTHWTKWFYLWFALHCSKTIRLSTTANAHRILGDSVTPAECRTFRNEVVSNFFNFVTDVAASLRLTQQQLLSRLERIDGEDKYLAARAHNRGAIIASIHMGSFEVAAAALHLREPHIHIVFKRDAMNRFEQLRSRARQNLGVIELPVDEGWGIWLRLHDALAQNQVVILQADRVMPGQKGLRMDFLHGHLLMPTGPVRLAMITGSPIIPIISTRTPTGQIQIHIEDAINVNTSDPIERPMLQLKNIIEKYVRTYPTQWLMLEPAFCEDQK